MKATDGVDQVWPIWVMPLLQLLSSLRLGQPTFHFSDGDDTLLTSSA